jgi:SAM-dependent methyltransferase
MRNTHLRGDSSNIYFVRFEPAHVKRHSAFSSGLPRFRFTAQRVITMPEVAIMQDYPKSDRTALIEERAQVSEAECEVLRQFGKEYFDGTRRQGLGGYHYHPRFFTPVVKRLIEQYGLTNQSSVLDVGCAKGFMLHDLVEALPGIQIAGIDISSYCMEQSLESVRPFLQLGSCDNLPYPDNSFDLVVSIATVHNLEEAGVRRSLREIMRVTRRDAFIKVNGSESEAERVAFEKWNVVAKTSKTVAEWLEMFEEEGYEGDYAWFKA